MTDREENTITGHVVDETTKITIVELCQACDVEAALIEAMIEEGILEPLESRNTTPCFTFNTITRTRIVVRLQRDLGVNLAGAGLALQLLDRIDDLRTELRHRR